MYIYIYTHTSYISEGIQLAGQLYTVMVIDILKPTDLSSQRSQHTHARCYLLHEGDGQAACVNTCVTTYGDVSAALLSLRKEGGSGEVVVSVT